ncbi:MAG: Double zinc ribbon [Oscillospiraceae bacterium]|nr:Double zinc ribbon [Oscillospiraceae bacterium]
MILQKRISKSSAILEGLNEIKRENIVQVNTISNMNGLIGYDVFYEDENIYACPKCGHHISNTFSYCPNCAHKMDPSVDEPLKCPTCKNNVAYTFDYCPHCATKLK